MNRLRVVILVVLTIILGPAAFIFIARGLDWFYTAAMAAAGRQYAACGVRGWPACEPGFYPIWEKPQLALLASALLFFLFLVCCVVYFINLWRIAWDADARKSGR